jgi:hypothetical protein
MARSRTKHTELLVRISTVIVLSSLNLCAIALDGDGRLSGAGLVVIVDNIAGRRIVLVRRAHVDSSWRNAGSLDVKVV